MAFNPFSSGPFASGGGSSGSLTAPVTITGVVGLSALTISGATQTTSKPVLDLTQTWNNVATTFTGLKFNVTDTASASASLLMDLQKGGVSQLSLSKSGALTVAGTFTNAAAYISTNDYVLWSAGRFAFSSTSSPTGTPDTFLGRNAAASLRLGAADAAAPVAQTLGVQSVVAGTSNTAGANFTYRAAASTGSAPGGSHVFQVTPAGGAGTAQNAFETAVTIQAGSAAGRKGLFVGDQSAFVNYVGIGTPALIVGTLSGISPTSFAGDQILLYNSSSNIIALNSAGINLGSAKTIGFSSAVTVGTADTILARDAANTLALRNSTNAQAFRVYNTTDGAGNDEYGGIVWDTNVLKIGGFTAGTGTKRDTSLFGDNIRFYIQNLYNVWTINTSGHLLAGVDNSYDIGASGATRPRNGYFGGTLQFGTHSALGAETVTGYITITDAGGTTRKLAVVS